MHCNIKLEGLRKGNVKSEEIDSESTQSKGKGSEIITSEEIRT